MNTTEVFTIEPAFTDDRGSIFDLVEAPVGHVGMITSNEGAVRANHYHLESTQYTYVISGKLELKTRHKDEDGEPRVDILEAGMLAVTPPHIIHAVTALEDTVFLDATTKSRTDDGYEEDTVRVDPL